MRKKAKRTEITAAQYLAGGTIIVGVLNAGSTAQAQLLVSSPNEYFESDTVSFNLHGLTISNPSQPTDQLSLNAGGFAKTGTLSALQLNTSLESTPLTVNSTFSGPTSPTDSFTLNTGVNYIGAEMDGHYGYVELTQETSFVEITDVDNGVTLNGWAYNTVAGDPIVVKDLRATPEPRSWALGLLTAAALGAAGLREYRRKSLTQ